MLSRRDALKAGAAGLASLLTLGNLSAAAVKELAALAHDEPMTAARLTALLREERAHWNDLLAEVGADRMEIAGVEGSWSVKQIVAHLSWYEHAVVDGARQVFSSGTYERPQNELTVLNMDERNARIAALAEAQPAADILASADKVFGELMTLLAAAPNHLLNDPHLLPLPDDIPPWMRVANNSYIHYREHAKAIRSWLDRQRD